MMKNLLLVLAIVSLSLVGCNNDDDTFTQDPLEGNWSLVRITGGLAGITDTIPPNVITYNFSSGNLSVTNNNPEPDFSFLQTGNYTYELTTNNNQQVLVIDDTTYEVISIDTEIFNLGDNRPVDGFGFAFER